MKFYKIEYRYYSWEQDSGSMLVSANSPAEAIEKAELQDAYEYSVHEYTSPYKLGSKAYSRYSGAYNALWLDKQGFEEEYPEMSDAQARDVYNDMCLYIDGYIYPWIK